MDTTRLENFISDLFSLEVNTIVKQGMMATKMPNIAHSLIDIAVDYEVKLKQFGAVGVEVESVASSEVFAELRKIASEEARVIQGLPRDREVARTSNQQPRELDDADAAKLLMLCRIRDTSDSLQTLMPPGLSFNRTQANDFQPSQLPLTDRQRLTLRKAWEVGTEEVVLQTSVYLDGDVISRLRPDYARPEKQGFLDAHQRGVNTSIAFWKSLVDVVRSMFARGT